MAEYKLCNALAGVYVGQKEVHYGYTCEVREDGIWVSLDSVTAKNWIAARRVHGPLREDPKPVEAKKAEKAPEPAVEVPKEPEVVEAPVVEEKPQTMTQVIEEGSGKRKYNKAQKV